MQGAIAWTEFLCGPLNSAEAMLAARIIEKRLPFGSDEAGIAATLFNRSGRRRGSLVDCMIAATAICAEAPLATANLTDFRRFKVDGLRLATD